MRLTPRRAWIWITSLLALAGATAAAAGPVADCPLANRSYSSNTVLIDLLINPATHAIVARDMGSVLDTLPQMFHASSPPSFASIVTPRMIAAWGIGPAVDIATLDADLATIPVTQADAVARCARYDLAPPVLPATLRQPAMLVFSKINGFRDNPSVDAATAALKAMGARRGWTLVFTENGAVFNARDLQRFKAVIWNNVSGDVLTLPQEEALKDYMAHGGGFAAFHGSGGDPYYVWDWYADTLIGARFLNHPMGPQFQAAKVMIDDPRDAIVRDLAPGWTMTEEWYSFTSSPRLKGAHILATLDENTYSPINHMFGNQDLRMGDHPIAWTQCIGDGRSFYTAIGHRPENYAEPHSLALLEHGIAWAAGEGESQCVNGKEVAETHQSSSGSN